MGRKEGGAEYQMRRTAWMSRGRMEVYKRVRGMTAGLEGQLPVYRCSSAISGTKSDGKGRTRNGIAVHPECASLSDPNPTIPASIG